MKYWEAITKNLKALKTIALFHPRLALLGVHSEIEVMQYEIDPYLSKEFGDILAEKARRKKRELPHAKTKAVQKLLLFFIGSKHLSEDVRHSLSTLVRLANNCRHTRAEMTSWRVDQAITDTIKLVGELREFPIPHKLVCPKCKRKGAEWYFKTVLDASIGERIEKECPQCGHEITYQVPSPLERLGVYEEKEDRKAAIRILSEVLAEVLEAQKPWNEIKEEELRIKRRLLKIVSEQGE